MIGYVLDCIRFRSPIIIKRPGPIARWRLWRDRRGRCHQCGRRMNGLDAGLEFPARRLGSRPDGRVFFCRQCSRDIFPGRSLAASTFFPPPGGAR